MYNEMKNKQAHSGILLPSSVTTFLSFQDANSVYSKMCAPMYMVVALGDHQSWQQRINSGKQARISKKYRDDETVNY